MIIKPNIWETFLIFIQVVYLLLILSFAYQQKYPQALILLIFSGTFISSKKKHPIIKLLNKISWGLAVVVIIHRYS